MLFDLIALLSALAVGYVVFQVLFTVGMRLVVGFEAARQAGSGRRNLDNVQP